MVAQVIRSVFSDKLSTKYQGIIQNFVNKSPIPIRHFDFKFNPASQMLILNALFDIWFQIEGNLEQIDNDIQRLDQAGVGGLISIETQLDRKSVV